MRQHATAVILGTVLLAVAGCAKKEEPRLEVKSQAKSTNADGGKTTTTTESLQVGSTLAGTTETSSDTAHGKAKSETETVIGQLKQTRVNPPVLTYLQARVLICKGQWPEAVRLLERARPQLEGSPQLTRQVDLFLGQCYERLEQAGQMFAAYEAAAKSNPDSVPALLGMAAAQWSQGKLDEAMAKYRLAW